MDTHALEIYLGLCQNLHFSQTSEQFHLSPSALSRAIQRLEQELGCTLLIRDNRAVSLTAQGEVFRQYAEEVVARGEQLRIDLGQSLATLTGKLSLFASVTASQSILPTVLARFRREYPGVEIQLETGYAGNALQRLSEGCDVVVAALPDTEQVHTTRRIITSSPMVAIAPATVNHLATGDIDWSVLPLVLPAAGPTRVYVEDWFHGQHIQPKIYSEVAGNEAILALVALGCGVGFVPQLVLENSPLADQVSVLTTALNLPDIHVGFCSRTRRLAMSPVIRAFWESI
jgi:LysR family positive regulator for ilvC